MGRKTTLVASPEEPERNSHQRMVDDEEKRDARILAFGNRKQRREIQKKRGIFKKGVKKSFTE